MLNRLLAFLVLAVSLCVSSTFAQELPLKAGTTPGTYLLGHTVLTVTADGEFSLAKTTMQVVPMGGVVPPGPGPGPGPGPLNDRAKAIQQAAAGITGDLDRAKNGAILCDFTVMLSVWCA